MPEPGDHHADRSGNETFNFSEVVAQRGRGLSSLYYPTRERSFGTRLPNGARCGIDAASFVVRESGGHQQASLAPETAIDSTER